MSALSQMGGAYLSSDSATALRDLYINMANELSENPEEGRVIARLIQSLQQNRDSQTLRTFFREFANSSSQQPLEQFLRTIPQN